MTAPATATIPPDPEAPGGAVHPAIWSSPYDLPVREKRIILAGSLIGLFLAALDQTIVSTAGPMIQRDLHIAPAIYPWLTTAYLAGPLVGGILTERLHVDVAGALLLIFAIAPLLCALSFGRTQVVPGDAGFPWTSPLIVGLFVVGIASLAGFVLQERRHKEPIVDFGMYGDRVFGVSNAGGFVLGAGFIAGPIFLPLYLVNVLHMSATEAGLSMIPLILGFVAGAALGGQLGSRLGRVKPVLLGAQLLLCVALAILGLTLSADAAPVTVSMRLVLVGLGMGPTLPLFTMAIQNSVRTEQIGVATASITFSRALGQVFGVGVLGSIFAGVIGAAAGVPVEGGVSAIVRLAESPEGREAITQGVRTLFQVGAATAVVGLFITQQLPDVRLAGRGPRRAAAAAD